MSLNSDGKRLPLGVSDIGGSVADIGPSIGDIGPSIGVIDGTDTPSGLMNHDAI